MDGQSPVSTHYSTNASLMYDWDQVLPLTYQFERPEQIELDGEILRDDLQGSSILQPSLEHQHQQAFLCLLPLLGIGCADIGYAGASPNALEDVVALAKTIVAENLPIVSNCAGRTHHPYSGRVTGMPTPCNYPIAGEDAFTTGTGVHVAAVMKVQARGDSRLADLGYSAVPAGLVGRGQEITIGPMSGQANAVAWLRAHGIEETPSLTAAILSAAKRAQRVLSDDALMQMIQAPAGKKSAQEAVI